MNDADNTQDQGLTTEQIATAGRAPAQEDIAGPAGRPGYDDDNAAPLATDAAPLATDNAVSGHDDRGAPDTGNGGGIAADPGSHASLLDDGELQNLTMRWKDIQAEFVDEPTTAVREADALVAELMQRLATMFASERAELENRWAGGNQVSTEELRQGLRLYRSFFERLLAA
jgi:hypothetical protein